MVYQNGELVARNIAKAVELYKAAVEQDDRQYTNVTVQSNAQYNLAEIYYRGDDAPQDIARAIELYETAAAQGHAGAVA